MGGSEWWAGWSVQVGLRGLRQGCRDGAGRVLVRDTDKQDRHKGEQEGRRAKRQAGARAKGEKPGHGQGKK